jgi:hypothetical protein
MHNFKIYFFLICLFLSLKVLASTKSNINDFKFLDFNQIKSLLTTSNPDLGAVNQLGKTLNTVFYSYDPSQKIPTIKADHDSNKQYIRISHWNLTNLDWRSFEQAYNSSRDLEIQLLRETDIFTLNNVGFDTENSKFQNTNELFSKLVTGGYIFITEFLEASPQLLGTYVPQDEEPYIKSQRESIRNNPYLRDTLENNTNISKPESKKGINDFKGLHGNAIVSKFPITKAWALRLPACYDWFKEEYKLLEKPPEKRERKEAKNRAGEGRVEMIRRGGRVALFAEIMLPNQQIITVVNTQLENRTIAKCRKEQFKHLLKEVKNIKTPVIIGADLNNFEKDAAPKTIGESVTEIVTNPEIIVKKVVTYFNPIAPITAITSLTYGNYRKLGDPTVRHVPIFLKNKSFGLFDTVHDYKFDDGSKFDFTGDDKLENSNERKKKGFKHSYEYKKFIGEGKVKLDWFFVKPINKGKSYYPKDPQTLQGINFSTEMEKHSFHYPLTIKIEF